MKVNDHIRMSYLDPLPMRRTLGSATKDTPAVTGTDHEGGNFGSNTVAAYHGAPTFREGLSLGEGENPSSEVQWAYEIEEAPAKLENFRPWPEPHALPYNECPQDAKERP